MYREVIIEMFCDKWNLSFYLKQTFKNGLASKGIESNSNRINEYEKGVLPKTRILKQAFTWE